MPHRHDDGYAVTNVYEGGVLLPITAEVIDPRAPVDLRLTLDIGVCEKVCIPDHVEAKLTCRPACPTASPQRLSPAPARRCRRARAGRPRRRKARRNGGTDKRPVFDIAVTAPDDAEVFVEGPADWYPDVPERVRRARPAVYRSPSTASARRRRSPGRPSA